MIPAAAAGIMGGESSEVTERTRRVLLEAAWFDPVTVRRGARILGLRTESSQRFERGADIEAVPRVLDRAAELIAETAAASVAPGRLDVYPAPRAAVEIRLRPARARRLLGLEASVEEMAGDLAALGLGVRSASEEGVAVTVPSFRVDLEREIDLVEELARVRGYHRIPSTMPAGRVAARGPSRDERMLDRVRRCLCGLGYRETIQYSFHDPAEMDRLGLSGEDPLRMQVGIRNPLSADQAVLRSSLLPGLLRTAARNRARAVTDLRIFETGRVFVPRPQGLPLEPRRLGGLAAGAAAPPGWDAPRREIDFFDVKGDLEALAEALAMPEPGFAACDLPPFLHPGRAAALRIGDESVGWVGQIHPAVAAAWDVARGTVCFEVDLDRLLALAGDVPTFTPIPRFPHVERDIAVIVDEEVPAADVAAAIRESGGDVVRAVRLFDVYRGDPVPPGSKSLAYRLRLQAADRTLTDAEANAVRDAVAAALARRLGARLRD